MHTHTHTRLPTLHFYSLVIDDYVIIPTGRCLSAAFPVHSELKEGNILSPLHFKLCSEHMMRKVESDSGRVSIQWCNQVLIKIIHWGDNEPIIKNNREMVLQVSG